MPKHFRIFIFFRQNLKEKQTFHFLFYIIYKFHDSDFVKLGDFVIWGFLFLYIYYTCRSLTRVGLLHRIEALTMPLVARRGRTIRHASRWYWLFKGEGKHLEAGNWRLMRRCEKGHKITRSINQ